MVKNAGNILLHPVSMALFLTLAISLVFLPRYRKYTAGILDKKQYQIPGIVMYDDLDGNGYSDRIITSTYPTGTAYITVSFEPSMFFQEWDFPGRFGFTRETYLLSGDYDGNGIKELYAFTLLGDSVFLNCVSDLFLKHPRFNRKFISRVGTVGDSVHLALIMGALDDLNGDGFRELVFALNAGLSLTPRQVFAYDIRHDSLYRSVPMGYHITGLVGADITGDGKPGIIVNGYASQNTKDPMLPVDDSCCWLIVLDHKLNFLFPPVELRNMGYSGLETIAVKNKNGFSDLYSMYIPPVASGEKTRLVHFDSRGQILRQRLIPGPTFGKAGAPVLMELDQQPLIAITDPDRSVTYFDTSFRLIKTLHLTYPLCVSSSMDIDNDGQAEIISLVPESQKLLIYRQDLSNQVEINLTLATPALTTISKKVSPGQPPLVVIDSGFDFYSITYHKNLLYYTRWGIYAGIFASIYLFILLIRRTQRSQIQKRYEIEKKITELQLTVVRNQMDPHFSMNAINSVIAAIANESREDATKSLIHFSKMFRALVLSGDRIERSLAEEIEFSKDYLEIEKFRFSGTFEYRVEIGPGVNLSSLVPKMIIQSPVENAMNHGLLTKESGGMLVIRAETDIHHLLLEIEDNGVGRTEAQKKKSSGTGKGLRIMEDFLGLYQKITGIRIDWQISDIPSSAGGVSGTRVIVRIPLKKE